MTRKKVFKIWMHFVWLAWFGLLESAVASQSFLRLHALGKWSSSILESLRRFVFVQFDWHFLATTTHYILILTFVFKVLQTPSTWLHRCHFASVIYFYFYLLLLWMCLSVNAFWTFWRKFSLLWLQSILINEIIPITRVTVDKFDLILTAESEATM